MIQERILQTKVAMVVAPMWEKNTKSNRRENGYQYMIYGHQTALHRIERGLRPLRT